MTTDGGDRGPVEPSLPPELVDPAAARPGLSTFTIEGRAAPGLFVVGWLATLAGVGLVLIGLLAPSGLFLYFLGPLLLAIGFIGGAGNQALERRARGFPYAGPSPYLVLAATVAAVYVVASSVGLVLQLSIGRGQVPDYWINLVGVSLQAAVFIAILRLTVVGTGALSWAQMGWRRFSGGALRDLLFGAAVAIPVIGLTSIVAWILVSIFRVVPESPLPPTGVAAGLVVQLIAGAVIAPIAEEAVFRGFAISAWRRTVGERGAIVRASLVFALAHVINISGGSIGEAGGLIAVGFASRLPVALALGWLFVRTGSIWAPIGLHMAFNGILLLAAESVQMSGAASSG
ncbi:MAG: CPBP family intramembrane metalloprotease [Chloroflexota bacterium]|nr:CPBP family intramembrane metalloprotease [Chloroflexota bacterium]